MWNKFVYMCNSLSVYGLYFDLDTIVENTLEYASYNSLLQDLC
jgi:hypothetical protein